jgi:septum formation protein
VARETEPPGAPYERAEVARTEVDFRALAPTEIATYVASGEPFDRAGAYAIQGGAAAFVARVDGEYENVVGLPLSVVERLLRERRLL